MTAAFGITWGRRCALPDFAVEKTTLSNALPARRSSVSGSTAGTLARTSARETSAAAPAKAARATTAGIVELASAMPAKATAWSA